ncbi:MAG: bacteriohemerythrin [Burkholderiaceae bacterium]|jgi:hemerythrin|nr:bacteriohemerythrin [Burkholderiaceae bacterium]
MAVLQWVPELNIGIPEIDKQHRRICDYINQLDEIRHTHDREKLSVVIAEVVDYTMSHFVFEEGLMEDAGYAFAAPHKRVHELVTRKVSELKTRFDNGEDVAEDLHRLLSRWLFNHIRNDDRGYVDAAQVFLRMSTGWQATQRAKMEAQAREAYDGRRKRGWLSRIFGG